MSKFVKLLKELVTPSHSMEFFHKPARDSFIDLSEMNYVRRNLKRDDFGHEVLTGPFGTLKTPVIVESIYNSRIIACEGGDGEEHDVLFHNLGQKKPTICLECGQVFKLKHISSEGEVMFF
ncbi:hypothetical protein DICPUDRAFT_56297 [Dictyostelium purpureum]|uniref:Uncharacterized protein n=1 Tax=Dictyostelium purpureum TaxID=5786 RepID=F0ZQN7_DICPU|nr:uncharacterized protein DICPUDRAFT_56297 [Dictyostelium purpureum]EGC33743.1 hypothetical protein DICPUDRAFT_56297 [Dictyostelium purpureum]|eukprot:XP_003289742.1 hypothetical protein DICPUDRAFT_56297 [Dictyostelium purpureum]